jgi:hypothetical protein
MVQIIAASIPSTSRTLSSTSKKAINATVPEGTTVFVELAVDTIELKEEALDRGL